jgi:hypothetical protein
MRLIGHHLSRRISPRARARTEQRRSKLAGAVRVLAYCLVVSLVFACFSLRSVLADVREASLRFGADLLKLGDMLGKPQPVVINGIRVFVGATHVDLSVKQALDRFQQYCEDHGQGFQEEFDKLSDAQRAKLPEALQKPERLGIFRSEAEDREGFLACLVAPPGSHGVSGVIARVEGFLESGDMARVGNVRYVFARKNVKAGSDLVTVWNEGPVSLTNMFFAEGDVPGSDIDGVQRPPDSVRIFDAQVLSGGYGIRAYKTHDSGARVLAGFEQRLSKLGWKLSQVPTTDTGAPIDPSVRTFARDGAAIFVSQDEGPEGTVATVIQMGTRGSVEATSPRPHSARIHRAPIIKTQAGGLSP